MYLFKIYDDLDGGYAFRRAEKEAKKQRRKQLLGRLTNPVTIRPSSDLPQPLI